MASKLLYTALAALLGAAASLAATGGKDAARAKVLLDTDIGDDIDDAFALALLLRSPELELVGITTAWGDTALRARLANRLLKEAGASGIPVVAGVPGTQAGAFTQADWAREGEPAGQTDAVGFLLAQARGFPGEVTLVAIGPLSNVGRAVERDPEGFRKFKRVVLMGGSIRRRYGDLGYSPDRGPEPEYNIKCDVAAAQKLFASGVPVFMMPLDSTQLLLDETKRTLLFSRGSPLSNALAALYFQWARSTRTPTPTLFDAMAVAYAIDPGLCPAEPMRIAVDQEGYTRPQAGASNASVCLDSDPEKFFRFLLPRLLGADGPPAGLFGRLDVGRPVAEQARRGERLAKDDADGNKDGPASGAEGNRDLHPGALRVLVAAAEGDAALRQVFADRHLLLKSPPADAGQDAGFHPGPVAPGQDPLFVRTAGGGGPVGGDLGLGFDPDRRRVADLADARHALAGFERLQLQLFQVHHLTPLAEAAFHKQARQGLLGPVRRREFDVPEIGPRLHDVHRVQEPFRLAVDLRHHAGPGAFDPLALQRPPQGHLLPGHERLLDPQHTAAAADQHGQGELTAQHASGVEPGRLERHAKGHPIALPQPFAAGGVHEAGGRSSSFESTKVRRGPRAAAGRACRMH